MIEISSFSITLTRFSNFRMNEAVQFNSLLRNFPRRDVTDNMKWHRLSLSLDHVGNEAS